MRLSRVSRAHGGDGMTRNQLLEELRAALEGMVSDYRSEGCPLPSCLVCQRSAAALVRAKAAIRMANVALDPAHGKSPDGSVELPDSPRADPGPTIAP